MPGLQQDHLGEIQARIISLATEDPGLPRPGPSTAFWQEPPHPVANVQSPALPEKVDFAIIGSGITACSVSHFLLSQASLADEHIAVFEARSLTSGATGRNGGHLVSPAATDFAAVASHFGAEKAEEVTRFSFKNLELFHEFVRSLDASLQEASEIRNVQTVLNCEDEHGWRACQESFRQFGEACPDLKDQYHFMTGEDAKMKHRFNVSVGALEHPAGAVWPYRLITGLFAKLLEQHDGRFTIDTHTPVTGVHHTSTAISYPYEIQTSRGSVQAAQVVYCTNGFTSHLLPRLRGKIYPLRGTMSTQQLAPEAPRLGDQFSWSFIREPKFDPKTEIATFGLYYMTQNAKTGDFFLGGENQKVDEILVSDDTVVPTLPAENLTGKMAILFHDESSQNYSATPKRIWSGIMGFTPDSMPLVGRLGEKWTGRSGNGEWIAAGFNGYGMDKCWLTGQTLGAIIAGQEPAVQLPKIFQASDERLANLSPTEIWRDMIRSS